MEEILRFVVLRAPDADLAEEREDHIVLIDPEAQGAVDAIDDLRSQPEPNANVPDVDEAKAPLADFEDVVADKDISLDDFGAVLKDIFGSNDPTADEQWDQIKTELDAAILDGKFHAGPNRKYLGLYARLRRAMFAIERGLDASNDGIKGSKFRDRLKRALGARFVIASPTPSEPRAHKQLDQYQAAKSKAIEQARSQVAIFQGLDEAVKEFEHLPPQHLIARSSEPAATQKRQTETSPRPTLLEHLRAYFGRPSDIGLDVSKPEAPAQLFINDSATKALSQRARDAMEKIGLDLAEQDYESSLHFLRRKQRETKQDVVATLKPYVTEETVLSWGHSMFATSQPSAPSNSLAYSVMQPTEPVGMWMPTNEKYPPTPASQPTCSPIKPSGFGQLLVIRQNLMSYERTEISHIENVMEGETRTRDHRRSVTTEETFLFERITDRVEERHLETTDRYELSSEVERTAKTEVQAKGELNVSGKYGPTVEFEASAGVQVTSSKEKTSKVALEFARESVEKAVNKIAERVREQRTRRIVEVVEEQNHHGFENDTPGHVVGMYQWLDKVYEAQLFDYGLRQLFDIIVPEPAAFLNAAFHAQPKSTQARLSRPLDFNLAPDLLTENNYADYVDRYGAKDVQAPPELIKTVAKTFALTDVEDWRKVRHSEGTELEIPEGYEAVYAYMTATLGGEYHDERPSVILVHVDRNWFYFNLHGPGDPPNPPQRTTASTPMNNQQAKIPVGWTAFRASPALATTEIRCRRTEAAMDQWRLDTHDKIKTAYQEKLSAYYAEQDKLALEATEELEGVNPAENKRLLETELKRAAISILANGRPLLDLMDIDTDDIPFVDLAARFNADPLIRFLEQAFEWENMNYLFYGYFWGRKEPYWKQKVLFRDNDSLFAQFVRAGTARVQIAVRPGFEDAVDHFLKTCEPWSGGDLPTITDPDYLPFADDLAAQLGRPGDEVPVGEPWEVRVPTSLVILRNGTDGTNLPKWVKQEDGSWVEHAEAVDNDN